jgi:hypothetical protein
MMSMMSDAREQSLVLLLFYDSSMLGWGVTSDSSACKWQIDVTQASS